MILYSQPLFQFVCLRVNSWFTFSRFAARPNTPIQPILPQSYSLCVLYHLCGVNSIMQNKPNSQNPKIPTTLFLARLYTNIPLCPTRKNKPNQTQFRPYPDCQSCPNFARILPPSKHDIRHTTSEIRDTLHASRDTTYGPFARPNCHLTPRAVERRILIDYRKRLQKTSLRPVGKAISNV